MSFFAIIFDGKWQTADGLRSDSVNPSDAGAYWARIARSAARFIFLIVKSFLIVLCRWLYLPLAVLCGFYFSLYLVQHSNWYKQRLYYRLLSGNHQQQLTAASALAHFGGQEQLLAGLSCEAPAVRELARRALEYLWFSAAGHAAHRAVEDAFQAAEKEDFQTALALNPHHYGAWQGIGVCRMQLGDVAEACRCLRAALKIIPHDDTTRRCLEKCEELLRAMPRPEPPAQPKKLLAQRE